MSTIGKQYDQIATWWDDYHRTSNYGTAQLERALAFTTSGGKALDVGCGAGGRLVNLLANKGFEVTGIDASQTMIELAQRNHPDFTFIKADIVEWESEDLFDFILAWDSLFHLPLSQQKPVLAKLCKKLRPEGIFIYTFGHGPKGEHVDTWRGQEFGYSTIGMTQNIETLHQNHMSIMHFELDQYPEKHAYCIARKQTLE